MGKKKKGCLHTFVIILVFGCILLLGVFALAGVILRYRAADQSGNQIVQEIAERLTPAQEIPYQEVEILSDDLGQKYYYQQLEEEEQLAYQEILQGVKERADEIYLHESEAERTNQLFQYVLKDWPEVFWCDGTSTSTSYEGKESYTVLKPKYIYDGEIIEQMEEEIGQSVTECLSEVPADASEYQRILYVYEYIVNTVDYDLQASDNQNIYSVFVNHRSVCAGYSKATQYLLERLGVFCTYVTGTTGGGQKHAWNLVMCDGDYYYVDTTWGDPVFQAAEGEEVSQFQNISYDYLCCDDTELLKNHRPDGEVELPACTKLDRNYYVMNGMYYESYDSSQILQKMNEVIAVKGNPVVFKFADSDVYGQAHEDVFRNVVKQAAQNLADWYGLQEVKYQYMDEPDLNKITIYWQYD